MDQKSLLRQIAERGYNVGFGAKTHFATYDIISKAPGWIGFSSIVVGVFALFVEQLASKTVSSIFLILGFSSVLINCYDSDKGKYDEAGKELTRILGRLEALYYKVKSSNKADYSEEVNELNGLVDTFHEKSISKQIFLSDWYAHHKFFWQMQIDWIKEERKIDFFRDMVPLSLYFTLAIIILAGLAILLFKHIS